MALTLSRPDGNDPRDYFLGSAERERRAKRMEEMEKLRRAAVSKAAREEKAKRHTSDLKGTGSITITDSIMDNVQWGTLGTTGTLTGNLIVGNARAGKITLS